MEELGRAAKPGVKISFIYIFLYILYLGCAAKPRVKIFFFTSPWVCSKAWGKQLFPPHLHSVVYQCVCLNGFIVKFLLLPAYVASQYTRCKMAQLLLSGGK